MENGFTDDDDGKQLWSQILAEVQTNAQLKQPGNRRSLLLLGDIGSGKTALVGRLRGGDEAPRRGHGLEYHCIEVPDAATAAAGGIGGAPTTEGGCRLGVWVLDGDPRHQNLLRFALTRENYQHTLAVLVGSAEAPWALLDSLQQWADILARHVDRLNLDQEESAEARDSLVRHFLDYSEPEVAEGNGAGAADNAAAAASGTSPTTTANVDSATQQHLRRAGMPPPNPLHPPPDPDKVALPLPEDVFTKNLGVPLVVVITKADAMAGTLERDLNYKEEQFDYLQYHLRKFCLKYGAGLVYTSAREDRNCSLLRSYLLHRVYGLPCNQPAYVLERDCVFVPAGWDSPAKAALLLAGGPAASLADASYAEVLPRPPSALSGSAAATNTTAAGASSSSGGGGSGGGQRRGDAASNDGELAEDEQVFLCRLQACLMKSTPSGGGAGGAGGAGIRGGATGASAAAAAMGGAGGAGAGAGGANDGVLATFFNSLLTKKAPGGAGGGSTGGGGTPSVASAAAPEPVKPQHS